MSTSGVVAQQAVIVDTLVTHAIQKCGKLPSTAGGELLQRVREALYFLMADLGNDGVNLWCMNKSVVKVQPYSAAYQLPVGTLDVTQVLYRDLWNIDGVFSGPSVVILQFTATESQPVNSISFEFAAPGTATLAVEYSTDGANWFTLLNLAPVTVVDGSTMTIDLDNTSTAQYWRLRELTAPSILGMRNILFRKVNNELPLWKLNLDDYANLPNKNTTGQKALQFWFDKQINPRMWVWPVPTTDVGQLVIWSASQPQDPGSMTNELAVPTRWYRYIAAALAREAAMLIPPNELPPGRLVELKADATEFRLRAIDGESDGASYQLAPNISPYTQ